MLKNNEERKQFILNDNNYELVLENKETGFLIKRMVLPNGSKIYQVNEWMESERYSNGFVPSHYAVSKYMLLNAKGNMNRRMSLNELADYLKDHRDELKELAVNKKEVL